MKRFSLSLKWKYRILGIFGFANGYLLCEAFYYMGVPIWIGIISTAIACGIVYYLIKSIE